MRKTLHNLSLFVYLLISFLLISVSMQAQITGPSDVCLNTTIQLKEATLNGTWSSSDNTIATVDQNGTVTGKGNGQCTIKYSPGLNNPDTWVVTVGSPASPAAIAASTSSICVGPSTLQVTDATANGTWSSDKPAIATIDVGGNVKGISTGVTNILYTVNNGCGTATSIISITVNDKPSPAAITGTTTLCKGLTTTLSDITPGGVWSDDNAGFISINSNGLVTGLNAGQENAYYSVTNGCGSNFVKTLINIDGPLASPAAISGNPASFCAGSTAQLADATLNGVWSSNNTSVASVSTSGLVTGIQGGTATISYTMSNSCGSLAAQALVTVNTVNAVTPAGINGANTLCSNASTILLTDYTPGGKWSSSNNSVASVDVNSGLVTGWAPGTAIISYTIANTCGSPASTAVNLTVNNCNCGSAPSAGTIFGPGSMVAGTTANFVESTGSGIWTSSNTGVANVDNSGKVTASAAGTTTIIYTVSSNCGSSSVATAALTVTAAPPPPDKCNGLAVLPAVSGNLIAQCITNNSFSFIDNTTGGTPFGTAPLYIYKWDFNDGTKSGNDKPTHIFTQPGDYDVALTVSDVNGCQTGGVIQVKVGAVPVAGYTVAFQTGGGVGTTFTSTSTIPSGNMTYSWDLGNGTSSTSNNPTVIYQPKTYTVTLTVTGSGGCTDIFSQIVDVVNSLVSPVTTVAPITGTGFFASNTLCLSVNTTPVVKDATPGGTWSSTNPNIVKVDTWGNITTVAAGTATIEYTVVSGGATSKATFVITVLGDPALPVINGVTNICTNSSVVFTANAPGGVWGSDASGIASIDVNGKITTGGTQGNANISYKVTNATCGTSATGKFPVIVATCCPPLVLNPITGSSTVQVGKTTTLADATNGGTWKSDNTSIATVDVWGNVTGVAAGSANITYTISNVCGAISVISFSINCTPVPVAPVCTLNASFTVNSSAQCITDNNFAFTDATSGGTAPYAYSWVFGDNITSIQQSPSHIYSKAGGYDVILTVVDSKGCSSNAAIQVTVGTVPVASFDVEYNTGTGKGITYVSTSSISAGTLTYSWTFGDGTSSTSSNPTVYYASAGTYKVTLDVAGVGDCKAEDIKYITYGNPGSGIPVAACPNPATISSGVTLSFTPVNPVNQVHAVILDANGKFVKEVTLTPVAGSGVLNISLALTGLTSGNTYYVKLFDQNHQLIGVSTIIVQ